MPQYCYRICQWNPRFKLLTFTFPQRIKHGYYYHRKYRITLKYLDLSGKQKSKTICFGLRGLSNKVDMQGQSKTRRKQQNDYFHPYFWEQILLNNKPCLKQAFCQAVDMLLLTNEQRQICQKAKSEVQK